MALDTLLISELPHKFEGIEIIASTYDLKLLGVYTKNEDLLITSLRASSNVLTLTSIKSFAWQEDNYNQEEYRLLLVNDNSEIYYYAIEVSVDNTHLKENVLSKWNVENIFQHFQELAKNLAVVASIEILKFEAKEAVFLFDKKTVVSFFPSATNDPQIMSISDLSDGSTSNRKVLLMKEILFVLNDSGTKFSIYSFSSNTKMLEFGFCDSNFKLKDELIVVNFAVNIKLDLLIFITEKQQVYSMPINITSQESQTPQNNSIITAFTKHFPSVKRLDEGLRKYSATSGSVQPICFNYDCRNFILKDLVVIENKLCILYKGEVQSIVGIHLLDTDETMYKIISEPAFIVRSGCEEVPFPLLLFCESKIYTLLYDIEQDKLVNELMIYPSSGAVKTLASLNNWVNIHMDIEVLRLGLSNRKIYTVEFYLKTLFEGFCQQWNAQFSPSWLENVQKECSLWEKILELVLENVCKNLSESFSCQYAEQLLQISISMVIQVLEIVESKDTDEHFLSIDEKRSILSKFSCCLIEMRKLLREQDYSSAEICDEEKSSSVVNFDSRVLIQWEKWKNFQWEEIIRDAILSGTVPLAQSYFHCCMQDYPRSSYKEIENVCQSFTLDCLRQGLIHETLRILLNMGIDINSKLLEVFKSTPERDVRSLLLNELNERNLLADSDTDMLHFTSLLEKLYPCTSFEHARLLLDEKWILSEIDFNCAVPENDETLQVGDLTSFSQDNSESGAYCHIVLNWLSTWDDDIRSRILAPHFIKTSPVLDFFIKEGGKNIEINPLSVWYYLLENGNIPYLRNWIESWLVSQNTNFSIFNKWPLNEIMINAVPERAPSVVSEVVLNIFSKYGVFCEEELEDISLFLMRIGQSQCDINDATIFSSENASLSFFDLCHRLVHYCLVHHLINFLYAFISTNYKKLPVWPLCHLCDVPLFNLTKSFYLWSLNHNDSRLAYDAMVNTAQHIYRLHTSSAVEILSDLPVPLSLAILLYKPKPLHEVFNEIQNYSGAAVHGIKEKFQHYPLLYNYLFKSRGERSQPDVTIYELLKSNTTFDTTQLFGWQSANAFKSEDSQNELPHFSLKSLSEQHGLKKDLTYIYYLLEGRPNYSYLKFLAQEVVLETGLSISRVRSACKDVIDYALASYRNTVISAACISFIELLGQDSLPLRTCLIAANMMHDNQVMENDQEYEKSLPEIWNQFKQAYLNKDSANILISELEKILMDKWNPYDCETDSLFKEITLWMPVMMLSHFYEVEAGTIYLNECAKQNSWLKFLVFSQVFQIPREVVLKISSRFSNSCISYHIFHALHKRPSLLYEVSQEGKNLPALKTPSKDMRKSLYSRIGVIKGVTSPETKKIVDQDDDKCSVSSEETSSSSDTDLRSFVLKDLFSQLLLAHSSDSPSEYLLHTSFEIKNPVLAVLAASYTDCSLESCFFVWLYTTLYHDESIRKKLETCFTQKRFISCSTDDIENLIVIAVQNNKIIILWQGIQFFLQTTPLMPLMEFMKHFVVYKKFESSIENFQNQLWDYPKNPGSPSVLHSSLWIENIAVCILKEAVTACSTNYERLILLRHFSHTRLEKSFSKEVIVPPFMKVCQMMQHLGDTGHNIDVKKLLLPETDGDYKSTCWDAVKLLLELHLYTNAEMFASVAKLPKKDLLLLQMNQDVEEACKSSCWKKLPNRIHFWKDLILKLIASGIPVRTSVEFLEVQCEISNMYGEKYFLMKSIISLLNETYENADLSDAKVYDLEALKKKMWWWCIKAEVSEELLPEIFDVKPMHELDIIDVFDDIKLPITTSFIEDEKEKEALKSIIGYFLSNKDVCKAFELSRTFKYECQDLKIIYTCLQLARNEIEAKSVNMSFPECASEVASSRIVKSLLLWVNSNYAGITAAQKDVIVCMEKLSRMSCAALSICHQILVHYTVASVLSKNYLAIAKEKKTFGILKQILTKKLNDEHIVAKSFIVVHELEDKDVAKFLSEEIWNSLQILSASDILVMLPEETNAFSENVIYDPLHTKEGFQLIVKLCQDPSILGNTLMGIFSKEADELSSKSGDNRFTAIVELCICAHEGFTAACNMDGISQILHESQLLVNLLVEAKKFAIMVRLLTGLGRYSEMMYVFDVLKSHDKFNLLFEKTTENVPNLRIALLDYLKRCPPSEADNYFYDLAKRFGMHREKAEILEMSVQKQLSQLCKRNMDNDLKEELQNAVQYLSEAAQSYCKADCLHQAQNCTRLAQLVALQIYFLPSGVWIIGLDEASVSRFILEHNKFSQAFIVAEEYGNHQLWSQALLNNVVLKENKKYLEEFRSQFGISTTLITDVVKRFQKVANKSESMIRNMKCLLSLCANIKAKYSLANELGFTDISSELLMGEGSSYLQDLIANNLVK